MCIDEIDKLELIKYRLDEANKSKKFNFEKKLDHDNSRFEI